MNLRIQNQGQQDIDSSSTLKSGTTQTGASLNSSKTTKSTIDALYATQDTTSISGASSQLSGDVPIRQDRVDALRNQIDSGTYSVNSHAVANAMFQNLFRS
jgi:flagellar biosynthesis anti-sigma factor FlgM